MCEMPRRRSEPYYVRAGLGVKGPEFMIGDPEDIAIYLCHDLNGELVVAELRSDAKTRGMCLTREQKYELYGFMKSLVERRTPNMARGSDMDHEEVKRDGGRNGWVCPTCGRVYSPDVMECTRCSDAPERSRQIAKGSGEVHLVETPQSGSSGPMPEPPENISGPYPA